MKTTVLYAIMSFSVLAAPAAATEPIAAGQALEARAGEKLGGIAMDKACLEQYGKTYRVATRGGTCNDWSCYKIEGNIPHPIDTPRACTTQYGRGVYAYCTSGVYGWGCYRS